LTRSSYRISATAQPIQVVHLATELLGIAATFAKYGATLGNVRWSVRAWAPDGLKV
jgi:hypothetical protein